MSTENVTKFQEAAAADPALQAKLAPIQSAALRQTAEKIAALATEAGCPFTAEEFLAGATADELSDEQLESVAGGLSTAGGIALSIFTFGIGCAVAAIDSQVKHGKASVCL